MCRESLAPPQFLLAALLAASVDVLTALLTALLIALVATSAASAVLTALFNVQAKPGFDAVLNVENSPASLCAL